MTGYKYQALLAALLLFVVAYPILRGPAGSPALAWALRMGVVLAGLVVIFTDRRFRLAAILLGVPAIGWGGIAHLLPERLEPAVATGAHLFAAVFQAFLLVVLVRGIHRERAVLFDAVAAALCGYLVIGMAFGHVYCAIAAVTPGSFTGLAPGLGENETHFLLIYFSLVTLTTVGYGDIVPAADTARSLAVVEAVIGQFYLAVLVADLVGKRIAAAVAPQPPRPE